METKIMLQLWLESRTRFTNLLQQISADDLNKRLNSSPNSIGFLIRHIGDVEFLFAKNVFGLSAIQVHAKTLIAQKDTGEWTSLTELIEYVHQSAAALQKAIEQQAEQSWNETITTKEFGTKVKAEALGRIVSHTTYHAGQIGMIMKYGE